MENFTFFFTKFKIKDFSVRTQLLPPPHSLPNMSGRFYAKNEADWTAGKKGPQPFHLIGQIMENKSVCSHAQIGPEGPEKGKLWWVVVVV